MVVYASRFGIFGRLIVIVEREFFAEDLFCRPVNNSEG